MRDKQFKKGTVWYLNRDNDIIIIVGKPSSVNLSPKKREHLVRIKHLAPTTKYGIVNWEYDVHIDSLKPVPKIIRILYERRKPNEVKQKVASKS